MAERPVQVLGCLRGELEEMQDGFLTSISVAVAEILCLMHLFTDF